MSTPKSGRFRLLIKEGSSEWEFYTNKKSFTLGRTTKSDICIPMQILSSLHLELTHVDGNKWFVTDKKSTNGSYLQDKKMEPDKPYQLSSPFSLRIGLKTEISFQISDLVEPAISPSEVAKTVELPKDYDHYQAALAKIQSESETKRREAEKKHEEEAYNLRQQLELLRKDIQAAEERKANYEKDAREYERSTQEKIDQKNQVAREVVELQRKLSQLSEQESDAKKNIQTLMSEVEIYRNEREAAKSLLDELLQRRESAEADLTSQAAKFEELKHLNIEQEKKLSDALSKESEAHAELHKSLKLIAEKEAHIASFADKLDALKKNISEKQSDLDALSLRLESVKRSHQNDESEYQVLQSKLAVARESLQLADAQRKTSEAAVDTLRAELLAAEAKLKRVNVETADLEDRATKLRSEVSAYSHKIQELEDSLQKLQENESRLKSDHESRLITFKAELENFEVEEKERIRLEVSALKSAHDRWEKEEREKLNLELKARKEDLLSWEKSEKERLQSQFTSQGEKLEKDLAERKQKELQAINELRSAWSKERDAKRPLEIREIVRSSSEMLGAHLLSLNLEVDKKEALVTSFKKDLEGVVKSVLLTGQGAQVETHLKAALVQSPEETLKAARKRKIWAIQAGSVLAMLLICFIFPSIPQGAWELGANVFRRDPQSADLFVERIRQARLNRPKFMPQRDRVFRNTYTDNIIYLEDYAEIKNDPDIKKAWTLALNKFFIEELDMDERIIVTFMAIESPLVRELTEMASKIQVKNQDSDISSMRAFEDLSTPRLIEAVKGRANYDKFREFELKFYDEYSNKLNASATPE